MLNKPTLSTLLQLNLLILQILSLTTFAKPKHKSTGLSCPNCGAMSVPFPLSMAPNCGDPLYKVRCTEGSLWLDTLNGSSYEVTSITPQIQRLIIRPQSFMGKSCINTDLRNGGIWLDEKLPFNISSENTVFKMNCTPLALDSPMNCSSNNLCHRYMKENPEVAKRCVGIPICCTFTGGGSQNDHNIKLTAEKCKVYTSFVGLPLDSQLPVSKWPQPGIAIRWALPREPICSSDLDCQRLPKSKCLPDIASGHKRCLCQAKLQWDGIDGKCSKVKCETKRCRKQRQQKKIILGLTYTMGTVAILVSFAILVYGQHQRVKRQAREQLVRERQQILNSNNTSGRSAKLFSSKEIKRATNNFSKETLLGSGGFGEVYKGKLNDGTQIAVKRAKLGNTKGTDQLLNEVRVLSQVNHRSLVKLLGCCVELDEPVLVYEYIHNGTLHDHLHECSSEDIKIRQLTWHHRLVIARQIAEGLAYLHFSAVPPIIHRDIKSTNILLDEKYDVKISDFGLSRLVDTEATHMTTCAQGTLGYLDPQYYRNMQLTDKSDVYSFGVVLLELLTSQKAIDFSKEVEHVSLAAYMKKMINNKSMMDAIDPFLKEGATKLEIETMKAVASLAMSCLEDERHIRPSMREVTEELEYMLHIISDKGPKM